MKERLHESNVKIWWSILKLNELFNSVRILPKLVRNFKFRTAFSNVTPLRWLSCANGASPWIAEDFEVRIWACAVIVFKIYSTFHSKQLSLLCFSFEFFNFYIPFRYVFCCSFIVWRSCFFISRYATPHCIQSVMKFYELITVSVSFIVRSVNILCFLLHWFPSLIYG